MVRYYVPLTRKDIMARNRYFEDEQLSESFKGKMLKKALFYIRPYKKTVAGIMLLMFFMGFVALIPPLCNRYLIDNVFGALDPNLKMAAAVIGAWILVGVSDVIYTFFRSRIMARTGYKIVRDMRRDIYKHLQTLAFDYYDSRPAGKILVRVTNYIDDLAGVFSSAILTLIIDTVKMCLVMIWLVILEPRLAVVAACMVLPLAAALFTIYHFLHKRSGFCRNKHSNRTAYLAESIQGTFVIKAFNRAEINGNINDEMTRSHNKAFRKFIRMNETIWPTMDFFWTLAIIGVYAVTLWLIFQGVNDGSGVINGISIGVLASFISYMGMFVAPMNNIAAVFQQVATASSNMERIFDIKATEPSIFDKKGAVDLPPIKGDVCFDNVTFAYEKGHNVLENMCLDVPAGKCIALVGPTGAGKSTVVNLLSRFYDVSGGSVAVDGHDISGVTLNSLRTQVGVMMQDSFIFSGTIMENIRFGRPDATDAECIAAAEAVFANEFIERLPDRYMQKTSEQGSTMSTGERQLLSFARTVLADPRILILDEATSSVDSETETKIQAALDILLKNRTSFVIAHRLSTIKKADCILYIADKGIKEAGTHEQLMERKGLYYELATGSHGK